MVRGSTCLLVPDRGPTRDKRTDTTTKNQLGKAVRLGRLLTRTEIAQRIVSPRPTQAWQTTRRVGDPGRMHSL